MRCTSPGAASSSGASGRSSGTGAAAGLTELPTCPVCLERLEGAASGLMTTVCNHTFHTDCIRNWYDATCPVCRHFMGEADDDEAPQCETCQARRNLWMCLVCGAVGCGRYDRKHALDHFRSTGHTYAVELDTQRVWDYSGDGYVHRLILNRTDGKMIELPDPEVVRGNSGRVVGRSDSGAYGGATEAHSSHAGGAAGSGASASAAAVAAASTAGAGQGQVQSTGGLVDEGVLYAKADAIFHEYNVLLTSQLEAQREYFEGQAAAAAARHADSRTALEERAMEAEERARAAGERADAAETRAGVAEKDRVAAEKRAEKAEKRAEESTRRALEAEGLLRSMQAGQEQWEARLARARSEGRQALD